MRRFFAILLFAASSLAQAAEPRIAVIYEGRENAGAAEFRQAIKDLPLKAQVDIYAVGKGGLVLNAETDLAGYALVFLDGAAKDLPLEAEKIEHLRAATKFVVVNPQPGLEGNVPLAQHPDLALYWANRSTDNDAALITYLGDRILGLQNGLKAPSPIVYPAHSFYHPDAPELFDSLEAYLSWYRSRDKGKGGKVHAYDPGALSLGILIHHSNVQRKNMKPWDALIAATERRGHNAIALVGNASPDLLQFQREGHAVIDALLCSTEGLNYGNRALGRAQAEQLGVPILMALNHHRLSPEEYRNVSGGHIPELTFRVAEGERDGTLEPIVIAARDPEDEIARQQPLSEQIEWRIERALAWAKLHRAANAEKRVVFTFWSEAGGKSDVGGDPDDFLDVPGSLATLLATLQERGYTLGKAPLPDAQTLARRMAREASNMGNWSPGEIAQRVAESNPVLIPESTYRKWFNTLPAKRRHEIEAVWGPPPGKTMIHTDDQGRRFIVIPRIEYGNVLIAPHPMWGYLEDEKVLLSKDALPPHHQYLAFFLWLQREWRADAWVSMFSNIVLQPGNIQGVMADDHIGILLGNLPHIHPERLGSNGGTGNKRKGLAALPGWYNIVVPSDSYESLGALRELLMRYRNASDSVLRGGIEPTLRQSIHEAGIGRALPLDIDHAPMPELLQALENYLAELEKANMPWGGKILGTAPQDAAMSAMVTGMLGKDLDRALLPVAGAPDNVGRLLVDEVVNQGQSVEFAVQKHLGRSVAGLEELKIQLERAMAHAAALRQAPREVEAIFAELEGRWVEPGPMGEPFRRPEALPPGRVLYNFDMNRVPTIEAEAVGVRQAEAQIEAWRAEHAGGYPQKLAFVLWSAEIAKNNGITEAQILHLLGTRAVRNWRGEVVDVELIPREKLGRPRIDVLVTTSGTYRDTYQSKVELIAKAARLAAASDEADNPIALATRDVEAALQKAGESSERARQLALARVYSPAPGAFSPSIQFLAKSGDQRGDEARMADLFTRRMGHAYGGGLYGDFSRKAFEANLAHTSAAILPRSSDVNGLLDHSQSAAFLGGLNMAAKAVTGNDISLYVSNLRDVDDPQIETAARALQTEMRTRYFNPKWLKENQAHGYDGARNFMFLTDHLDLWDTTATQVVASADWAEVKSVFVDDKFKLDMDQFFDRNNPYAQQMLLTNLLGAAQRGHWEASAEELAQVARRLSESVIAHGPACEANQCRNAQMTEFVAKALASLPDAVDLIEGYKAAIEHSTAEKRAIPTTGYGLDGAAPPVAQAVAPSVPTLPPDLPALPRIEGMRLDRVDPLPPPPSPTLAMLLIVLMASALGAWRQQGGGFRFPMPRSST
jgi:cobaltochelatase CobN